MYQLSAIDYNDNLVVSVDSVKPHVKVEASFTEDDDLIEQYIRAGTIYCQSIANEMFLQSTFKYSVANPIHLCWGESAIIGFPCGANSYLKFPIGPIVSVTSIEYYDANDTLQTLATDSYGALDKYVIFYSSFPALSQKKMNSIQITFEVGYSDIDEYGSNSVPENIKQAIRLVAAEYYRNREMSVVSSGTTFAVERLLSK